MTPLMLIGQRREMSFSCVLMWQGDESFGSLRDFEEALAELEAQNVQLEEDCKDLEALLCLFVQ